MKTIVKCFLAIFLLIFAVYISFQVYKVVYPSYRSETAVLFAVNDSVACRGIAIRNESVIDFETSGTLNYKVNDGDKIATDSVVADVYLSKTIARDVKLRNVLQNEITAFKNAENANQYAASNLDSMSDQIHRLIINLSQSIDDNSFVSFETNRLACLESMSIFASATGADLGYDSVISRLSEEIELINQVMLSKSDEIRATEGGYFASFTDGFEVLRCDGENVYFDIGDDSMEIITPLDPSDIENLIKSSDIYKPDKNSCKVILDYTWYFAALIDTRYASRFYEGQELTLDLNNALVKDLPVKIESIMGDDTADSVMILFSCEHLNSDMTGLRIEEGEISFKNYVGIRVPRNAIRVVEGAVGVFTKYDNKVIFKKIKYIYETDEYVLVIPSEKSDELKLYDEMILEGKDLYDGKSLG